MTSTQPTSPEILVSEVRNLVSLPDVAAQINAMVDDPHATTADMAAIISTDPNLTARLLRIANVIATLAEINSTHLEDVPTIAPGAWKQAGIREEMLEPVMREAQRQFRDARQVFLADAA